MSSCPSGSYTYTIHSGDSLWLIAQLFHTTASAILGLNPGLDAYNLQVGQVICIPHAVPPQPMPAETRTSVLTLSNLMRLLWEQHVYWTRMVILGLAFGLPDTEVSVERLLRNPKEFEASLAPFYGQAAAAQLAALLTSHLTIASELVKAAKAGDSAKAADAERRWYINADQIAAFLGKVNPHWSVQVWQKLLHDHLAMTKEEAADVLTKDYAGSVQGFDQIEQQALRMADLMTQGVVKQFPQYFL